MAEDVIEDVDRTRVVITRRTPNGITIRYGEREPVEFQRSSGQVLEFDADGQPKCPGCGSSEIIAQEFVYSRRDIRSMDDGVITIDGLSQEDGEAGEVGGLMAPAYCRGCSLELELPDAEIEYS